MNKITDLKKKVKNLKNKYWLALAANAAIIAGDCGHNLMTEEKKQDKVETVAKNPEATDPKAEEKGFIMSILLMTEGCTLKVYTDHVGVNTVGLGSTYTKDGKKVGPNDNLSSNEEAFDLAFLLYDKNEYAFDYVERNLLPNQLAAIGDCMYNCGPKALVKDGKPTKLCQAISEGNDAAAMEELLTYSKAGGSFCTGLFFRRVLEAYIYKGFISLEEAQRFVIGGLSAVSCNKEMQEAFNLKIIKRKGKVTATYDIAALDDINVARKLVALCQTEFDNIKMSEKMKSFHFGELVTNFIPQQYLCQNTKRKKSEPTFLWKKINDLRNLNKKS